ncbi:MAG: ABC transporter substrate-binding protein, partial [Tissierellia bacterium]|nr:ABC transporter substrate-binding protein [Tissierellia bacterium]
MKLKSIFCYLLIFALVLTGCSGGGNNTSNTELKEETGNNEVQSDPVKDSVVFSINAEPSTLDPQKGNDLLTFMVHCQIFDTLIRESSDGTLVPGIAEEWKFSDDGKEIVFKLRNDVKFHNGDQMTADDVVFSFNRAINSTFTKRITGSMDRMEKVDDSNVKLILKYSYGPVLDCIATSNLGIVSQKAVEADEEGFARNPVGTGAFKFVEWSNGEKIVFESFDDYYRGEANIKNLTFKIISDKTSAAVALENGEVDVLLSPAEADRNNLIDNENIKYYETESNSFYFISFNNEEGLFSNKLLREAISYAIDRESLIIGALEGNGAALESAIPTNCFGAPQNFKG